MRSSRQCCLQTYSDEAFQTCPALRRSRYCLALFFRATHECSSDEERAPANFSRKQRDSVGCDWHTVLGNLAEDFKVSQFPVRNCWDRSNALRGKFSCRSRDVPYGHRRLGCVRFDAHPANRPADTRLLYPATADYWACYRHRGFRGRFLLDVQTNFTATFKLSRFCYRLSR